jgi:DNA-binding transcriptional LysR family regulator
MDRFDAMRALIRIVERRSFTLAAQDIGVPRWLNSNKGT